MQTLLVPLLSLKIEEPPPLGPLSSHPPELSHEGCGTLVIFNELFELGVGSIKVAILIHQINTTLQLQSISKGEGTLQLSECNCALIWTVTHHRETLFKVDSGQTYF